MSYPDRTIDVMAAETNALRALRPLRVFSDLEHERDERSPNIDWPARQLALAEG